MHFACSGPEWRQGLGCVNRGAELKNSQPLSSLHAQQVFDRGYEMCANALFSLSVVLRFIGSEAQAQEVDALVDASIDQNLEDLRQESRRLREIAESNGIESAIGYTSARTVEVKITSPRAIRYLAIIREFDGMLAQMDALWLSSVVTNAQYARGVYEWKRRILRLAGQIRQIASRAVLAARRKEAGDMAGEAGDHPASETDELPTETFTSDVSRGE